MTPLTNSIVRTAEKEADLFGLNAAREPHGFASVAMRLSTYRKLDPSPLEEMLFFDHPSGTSRVAMAMRSFKEHPDAGSAPSR
jgi:STE24 endopeptidase